MLVKERIQFIDLAKGFTILIIALTHTFGDSGGYLMEIFSIFKVPTFFVLSGLFFKTYDSYKTFFRKKIRQLVIPLLFTFLFLSLPWTLLLELHFGESIILYSLFFLPETCQLNFGMAPGAWFVFCLLIIEFLFYIICVLSKDNIAIFSVVALFAGISGYVINFYDISLPIWIDTALTSMPFFLLGIVLGRYSDILQYGLTLKQQILFVVSTFALLFFILMLGDGMIFYAINRYSVGLLFLFGGGVCGAIFVILLSKLINKLPLVSFIGRYSMIMLLTHQFYLFIFRNIAYQLHLPQDSNLFNITLFVIVVLLEVPTIYLCKKYIPWAFGLKKEAYEKSRFI